MTNSEIIIVGGGPAGSTCAWKLKEAGREVLLLDKQDFPRTKPCAGWLTPRVVRDLRLSEDNYPHSVSVFSRISFHYGNRSFRLPTRQYAIRRIEFDQWLLQRAGVQVVKHAVADIRRENDEYVIDGTYRCRFIVGAGGTHCPVYRTLFKDLRPHPPHLQISAIEDEYPAQLIEHGCHLWFSRDLPGYGWYVPKGETHMNVGVGGTTYGMETRGKSIRNYWNVLLGVLGAGPFLPGQPAEPRGHVYYLRHDTGPVQIGNAYIVGDSAGLATTDMGEGIAPAVRSGMLAAESILSGKAYAIGSLSRHSGFELVWPGARNRTAWKSIDPTRC